MADHSELCLLGIDPLLNVDVKLFVKDILSLAANDSLKGFFKFYQHAIQHAEICGCIVAIERKSTSIIYTVDDGTGTIECIFEPETLSKDDPSNLGDCVRVSGKINDFRDKRELKAHALASMDPNEELMHNVQVLSLKKEYQKPFEIPPEFRTFTKELASQLKEEEKSLGIARSDMSEEMIDKEAFCNALLSYLKANFSDQPKFSPTPALGDENLKVLAREAMLNSEYTANPTLKQVSQFYYKNIRELENRGHLALVDPRAGLYRIIDEDHLKNEVVCIIQERLEEMPNYIGGVSEEYIVAKIQVESQTPFPPDKILKLVKEMVDQSIIYLCAPGEYHTL